MTLIVHWYLIPLPLVHVSPFSVGPFSGAQCVRCSPLPPLLLGVVLISEAAFPSSLSLFLALFCNFYSCREQSLRNFKVNMLFACFISKKDVFKVTWRNHKGPSASLVEGRGKILSKPLLSKTGSTSSGCYGVC